jgi:N-methylhydantoinase A
VLDSIAAVGLEPPDIAELVHGHTVGINAVLSRRGAKTALVCTSGHRDLLDIGRMNREFGSNCYDPTWLRPHQARPIVERALRMPVPERIDGNGDTLLPLAEGAVRATARRLREEGVESVAVCFLNSYLNSGNESVALQVLRQELPGAYVQSSALYPVTKEHERTTTVALDAYVGPAISGYLTRLQALLRERGFGGSLWIMLMSGGVGTLDEALRTPVFQLVSGPVGGVGAAVRLCSDTDVKNLLTMDVGGTSTDVAVITDGQTPMTDLWTIEHGLTLTMPLVDVGSVGSGAGSIIGYDALGSLRVGPESAGSVPGPACYGRGGREPALTDACAVLGILQPDLFANGTLRLDVDAAATALEQAGAPAGMSALGLAASAYRLACEDIAGKIRSISIHRGVDVRRFTLLAFGAAGPMLANQVARILGVRRVMVPSSPGQFSALGLLRSDLRVTTARSPMTSLTPDSAARIEESFREQERELAGNLASQGVDTAGIRYERAFFAMYAGQTWDNRLPLAPGAVTGERVADMIAAYHQLCQSSYGFSVEELPVVLTTLEVTAVIKRARRPAQAPARPARSSLVRTATVHLPEAGPAALEVHRREDMATGQDVAGPAVITERFATTLVLPGYTGHVAPDGVLLINQEGTRE